MYSYLAKNVLTKKYERCYYLIILACSPQWYGALWEWESKLKGKGEVVGRVSGAKMAARNSFSNICTRALHSFRSFAPPPPLFLCCLRPPPHHPSSLTSVSLVPDLHLLPPSTPFWPYGTHPFFPHAQTISILSDLLYSLTNFLLQLSYAPLHS